MVSQNIPSHVTFIVDLFTMTAVRAAARLVSSIGVLSLVLENLSTHTLLSDPRTQKAGDGPACVRYVFDLF